MEGIPKVAEKLVTMFHAAKTAAGVPLTTPLAALVRGNKHASGW